MPIDVVTSVTSKPKGILSAVKKATDEGQVETWEYDADGDFIHTPPQWKGKAWLRPAASQDLLRLSIISPEGVEMDAVVYAGYHGRFIEMLLALFDGRFESASASAS